MPGMDPENGLEPQFLGLSGSEEQNQALVLQELSNLKALKRLSLNAAGSSMADPDLPTDPTEMDHSPLVRSASMSLSRQASSKNLPQRQQSRLGRASRPARSNSLNLSQTPSDMEDLWVPAGVHPELAPNEWKSFVDQKLAEIQHSREHARPHSKHISRLSREVANMDDYVDAADILDEKRRSVSGEDKRNSILELSRDFSRSPSPQAQPPQPLSPQLNFGTEEAENPVVPQFGATQLRRSTHRMVKPNLNKRSRPSLSKLAIKSAIAQTSEQPPSPSAMQPSQTASSMLGYRRGLRPKRGEESQLQHQYKPQPDSPRPVDLADSGGNNEPQSSQPTNDGKPQEIDSVREASKPKLAEPFKEPKERRTSTLSNSDNVSQKSNESKGSGEMLRESAQKTSTDALSTGTQISAVKGSVVLPEPVEIEDSFINEHEVEPEQESSPQMEPKMEHKSEPELGEPLQVPQEELHSENPHEQVDSKAPESEDLKEPEDTEIETADLHIYEHSPQIRVHDPEIHEADGENEDHLDTHRTHSSPTVDTASINSLSSEDELETEGDSLDKPVTHNSTEETHIRNESINNRKRNSQEFSENGHNDLSGSDHSQEGEDHSSTTGRRWRWLEDKLFKKKTKKSRHGKNKDRSDSRDDNSHDELDQQSPPASPTSSTLKSPTLSPKSAKSRSSSEKKRKSFVSQITSPVSPKPKAKNGGSRGNARPRRANRRGGHSRNHSRVSNDAHGQPTTESQQSAQPPQQYSGQIDMPFEIKLPYEIPAHQVTDRSFLMMHHRFPLHIERAIYRLSHMKLSNPRRPLREQVLLSNFMYAYLNLVNYGYQQQQLQAYAMQNGFSLNDLENIQVQQLQSMENQPYNKGYTSAAQDSSSSSEDEQIQDSSIET